MADRSITLDAVDIAGVPMKGRLRATPLGLRPSSPVLVGGGWREYPIEEGMLPVGVTIATGLTYQLAIYEEGATTPCVKPWLAYVEESIDPVSVGELYRQGNGDAPQARLLPLYSGDDLRRLRMPGSTPGQILTTTAGGGVAAVDPGETATVEWGNITNTPAQFTPAAHASRHASNGDDPITAASIGAVTTAALTAEAEARAQMDNTLATSIAEKAAIGHSHDERYYSRADIDTLLAGIGGGGAGTTGRFIVAEVQPEGVDGATATGTRQVMPLNTVIQPQSWATLDPSTSIVTLQPGRYTGWRGPTIKNAGQLVCWLVRTASMTDIGTGAYAYGGTSIYDRFWLPCVEFTLEEPTQIHVEQWAGANAQFGIHIYKGPYLEGNVYGALIIDRMG